MEKPRVLAATTTPYDREIPSNPLGDEALRVVLPNVVPGNYLEVDISFNLANFDIAAHELTFVAGVSFVEDPIFPADFQIIDNSVGGGVVAPGFACFRSLSLVKIPDGAVKATITVPYSTPLAIITIFGTDAFPGTPGSWLKASELAASLVSQPGTGTLAPIL
jgi:hypothetical protein